MIISIYVDLYAEREFTQIPMLKEKNEFTQIPMLKEKNQSQITIVIWDSKREQMAAMPGSSAK